jgi:hypothetical protein
MAHLIDKDALVAEIERKINEVNHDNIEDWRYRLQGERDIGVMKNILSLINTLEVKEVDSEKEADEMWNYVFSELGWDENTRMAITHKEFMALAKHFFELGVKAKG